MIAPLIASLLAVAPYGNVVVTCDCTGVIVYLDGRASGPVPQPQVVLQGVPAGRHTLKADAFPTQFQKVTWYDGVVDIAPGMEIRAKVKNGRFDIYSTTRL